MSVVRLPIGGGCSCGAARYALTGAPLLVYACHCHLCQSRSGAAFTLNMVVRWPDLAPERGCGSREVVRASGRRLDQGYCPACHGLLWSRNQGAPDFASLPAGTLDDAGWVRPVAQTFVESAIPWAVIPGVQSVAWADFDYVALGREWSVEAPAFEGGRT